jgi:hypothetical protein
VERNPVKYALILIALLLILPAAFTSGVFGPTSEDVELATAPVIRLPLDALMRAGSVSVIFEVPAGVQWTRIRNAWGDPDYIVFAVSKTDGTIVSWSSVGVAVTASIASRPLPVEPAASTPYGYSSSAQDPGVAIRAGPGARVRVDFAVLSPNPESATEIVIQPEWEGMKDRIVGVALNLHLRPHIRVASVFGVLLLAVAAFIRD